MSEEQKGQAVNASATEPKKTKAQAELEALQLETARLEFEAKQLEIKERKAHLQDLEEQLANRELLRETKRQRSITNGATLNQLAAIDKAQQSRCNHKKGGNGAQGVVGGQGDDSQYAVIKHTFGNGDMWVRCLRCGKTWKPPIRSHFAKEEDYLKAVVAYETAINFQTRNVPSSSVQFRFSDNGEYYRKVTENSKLR